MQRPTKNVEVYRKPNRVSAIWIYIISNSTFNIYISDCVSVQVEWESHPLGSAVQTETRDHREVSESDRRQIPAADGQRES